MSKHLVSWIGQVDLALLPALKMAEVSSATLLYNYKKKDVEPFLAWLQKNTETLFDISAEFLPELVKKRDQKLLELSVADASRVTETSRALDANGCSQFQ